MHPYYIEILCRNHTKLIDNLQVCRPGELLDHLYQYNVVTVDQKEDIASRSINREKANALVMYLQHCPPDLKPFETFIKCLKETRQGWLSQLLIDTQTDIDGDHLKNSVYCPMCSVHRYVDPTDLIGRLFENGLIGQRVYSCLTTRECSGLATMDRNEKILKLIVGYSMPSNDFQTLKDSLCSVLNPRSPSVADLIKSIHEPDDLLMCTCLHKIHADDVCVSPDATLSGPKNKLKLVQSLSANLMKLITFGRHDDFHKNVKVLLKTQTDNPDLIAIALIHKAMKHYCDGNLDLAIKSFETIQKTMRLSPCSTYHDIAFLAIKSGVYRKKGMYLEAKGCVEGGLQRSQCNYPDKSMALLHERYGILILHERDMFGEIMIPTEAQKTKAARFLYRAYELYKKTYEFVSNPTSFMLNEFANWPMLEYVFVKLGTCVAGHYQSEEEITKSDWRQIENAMERLTNNFKSLSPQRKVTYNLMYSDYSFMKAKSTGLVDLDQVKELLHQARHYAQEAAVLVDNSHINKGLRKYAERRQKFIGDYWTALFPLEEIGSQEIKQGYSILSWGKKFEHEHWLKNSVVLVLIAVFTIINWCYFKYYT